MILSFLLSQKAVFYNPVSSSHLSVNYRYHPHALTTSPCIIKELIHFYFFLFSAFFLLDSPYSIKTQQ